MNILVFCTGFIGDILFASSLAKKLKEKYPGCFIVYEIPLVQPKILLQQNPFIDLVRTYDDAVVGLPRYDLTIRIPSVNQAYPATVQMQAAAGIEDQSLEFPVWTLREYDEDAIEQLTMLGALHDEAPIYVAVQNNWAEKSFEFTREEYDRAIDVPNLGYGGRHRNIPTILKQLDKPYICLVNVGLRDGVSQRSPDAHNAHSYAMTASLIKMCDYFIGSEGGLSNLAAAVGTRCIITTDFIHQLYGPKGVIRQLEDPQMGPAVYYPYSNHVHLDPYLTDEEVGQAIMNIIDTDLQF